MKLSRKEQTALAGKLLAKAKADRKKLMDAIASDGASAPSTLNVVQYVDNRKRDTKCPTCGRDNKYFEGCSMVECPERKPVTCALRGDSEWQRSREREA